MPGFKLTIEGVDETIAELEHNLGDQAIAAFIDTHRDCVEHIENRAREGIANGPKTGRVYTTRFFTRGRGASRTVHAYGSRPPHQASARGQYPASDTGNLMRTIWSDVYDELAVANLAPGDVQLSINLSDLASAEGQIRGEVGCDAEYAVPLEYKDPGDGGRPFLRRAAAESEDFIRERYGALKGKFSEGF